jgi:hypothetical protein
MLRDCVEERRIWSIIGLSNVEGLCGGEEDLEHNWIDNGCGCSNAMQCMD